MPQTLKVHQMCDIAYLNQLGEDGWELVSCDVDHEDVGKPATMIFKRSSASLLSRGLSAEENRVSPISTNMAKPTGIRFE